MNEIVKYNNQMNKLSFTGFTKTHIDFFMAICSKMREKGTDEVIISTRELKEITRYEKGGGRDFFEELDEMTDRLQHVNGKMVDRTIGQRKFIKFTIFPTFEYDEEGEWLRVKVNDRFAWLLNEFENYTTFELAEFIGLKSKYSKNLYRLLKQWRTVGKYTFNDLDEFRKLMDIPTSYSNKYMMNECVNVAIEEISKSDGSFKGFRCEPVYARKRGMPLDKLIFTWQAEKAEFVPRDNQLDGQEGFFDPRSFDEYVQDYKGKDKPSPVAIKIAKDIEKGGKKPKKLNFNNFEGRKYTDEEMSELEKKLLGWDDDRGDE